MKVQDLMSQNVKWVDPNMNLSDVAKILTSADIGSVPVCEGKDVIGIITDRDIIVRAISQGLDAKTTKVSEIMTRSVTTVSPDTDIHEAADLMAEKQIRRLPVVDHNQLVGFLALKDVAVETIHVNEAGEALSEISERLQ